MMIDTGVRFMNKEHIIDQLLSVGDAKTKSIYEKQSNSIKAFGVKMKDIRHLAKTIKRDHALAEALYHEGLYETMMLACFIVDPKQLTHSQLKTWAIKASSTYIIDQGFSQFILDIDDYQGLLNAWSQDDNIHCRYAGYALHSTVLRRAPLSDIDASEYMDILERVKATIKEEPLEIQNAMNTMVVMAGLHVPKLKDKAREVAEQIGYILPRATKNKCNIQSALDYLDRYITNPRYSRTAKLNEGDK